MSSTEVNINKNSIRLNYDKPIISRFSEQKSQKLIYFGLPGRNMTDVIEWKEYIEKIFAVEIDEIERHLIMVTAFQNRLDKMLEVFVGDIDELLLRGCDKYETPLDCAFDLINLDYYGGLIYKDLKGDSKRIEALRKLIERQRLNKQDFLLLLTFNTRNRDEDEFDKTLDQIDLELDSVGLDVSPSIDWYIDARYDYKIKVYAIYILNRIGAANGFFLNNKILQPPVTYLGTSHRRMVHFALPFNYNADIIGTAPTLSSVDILNLTLLECRNGNLQTCSPRPPLLRIKM